MAPQQGPNAADTGWLALFNGKDLTGWTIQRHGYDSVKWGWEDNALIGRHTTHIVNSHGLLTTSMNDFRDFQVRFQAKVTGRSSVFSFRDQPGQGNDKGQGFGVVLRGTKPLVGNAPEEPSGTLFHSVGRELPERLASVSRDCWKLGDWNDVEVVAEGPRIRVRINGENIVDYTDRKGETQSGRLTFLYRAQTEVALRNMFIKRITMPADAGWVPLFDGRSTAGWQQTAGWKVDAGVLIGSGPKSHLFSERGDYENFHLCVEARINDLGNSGVYFRAQPTPNFPKGYEAQIQATGKDQKTGSLYNLVRSYEAPHKPNEWFKLEVIANGSRMTIIVNGKTTVNEYQDSTYTRGHIALQQHHAGGVVEFRKIEIKELPPKAPAGNP